jgi:hypothetical protein
MKPGEINKLAIRAILNTIFGPELVTEEHRFHPVRRWRFDYAIPSIKLAVEYHGHAGFIGGKTSGHSSIKGLTNDCEKINSAIGSGWRVLAFTALHFRADGRHKHNLTEPRRTILQALAAMQDELETKP